MIKRWIWVMEFALLAHGSVSLQAGLQSSTVAIDYLNRAIDIMQQNAFRRNSVDWPKLRQDALSMAAGSESPADTYEAIRYALRQLGDHHSFPQLTSTELQIKDREARRRRKEDRPPTRPKEPPPPSLYVNRRVPSAEVEKIEGSQVAIVIVPQFEQSDDATTHIYAETSESNLRNLLFSNPRDGSLIFGAILVGACGLCLPVFRRSLEIRP